MKGARQMPGVLVKMPPDLKEVAERTWRKNQAFEA